MVDSSAGLKPRLLYWTGDPALDAVLDRLGRDATFDEKAWRQAIANSDELDELAETERVRRLLSGRGPAC